MKNRLQLAVIASVLTLSVSHICADAFSRFTAAKTPQARLVELAQLYAEAIPSRAVQTKIAKSREFTGNKKNLKGIRASILNKIKSESALLAKRAGGIDPAELERAEREKLAALTRATEAGRSLSGVASERDTLAGRLSAAELAAATSGARITDLERLLGEANKRATDASTRADELARQLTVAQTQAAAANTRATTAETQAADLQRQLDAARTNAGTLNDRIHQLETDLAAARAAATRATEDATRANERVRALEGQLAEAGRERDREHTRAEDLATRLAALQAELVRAQERIRVLESLPAEVERLSRANQELQNQLGQVRKDADNAARIATERIRVLEEQLRAAQASGLEKDRLIVQLREQLETVTAERDRLRGIIGGEPPVGGETLLAQIARLNAEIKRLRGELTRVEGERDLVLDEVTRLQNELTAVQRRAEEALQRVEGLRQQLNEQQRANEALRVENTGLRGRITELERANGTLAEQVRALTERVTVLERENADLRTRIGGGEGGLTGELARLQRELAQARRDLETVRNENRRLTDELAALREQLGHCGVGGGNPAAIAAELLRLRNLVKSLEQQVVVKDAEIADLNRRLREALGRAGELAQQLAALGEEDRARLRQLEAVFSGDLQEAIRLLVKEPLKMLSYMEPYAPYGHRDAPQFLGGKALTALDVKGIESQFLNHLLYIDRGAHVDNPLGIGSDWFKELKEKAKVADVAGGDAAGALNSALDRLNRSVQILGHRRGMADWNNLRESLRDADGIITIARKFIPRRILDQALSDTEKALLRRVGVPASLAARWKKEDGAVVADAPEVDVAEGDEH